MRPRYRDLFDAILSGDTARSDAAFDAILFERADALPDLVECYLEAEDNVRLRQVAVQLMGFSGSERAVAPVVEALMDPAPSVRAEACLALLDLKARDAMGALRERVEDLDPDVRSAALDALAGLGS